MITLSLERGFRIFELATVGYKQTPKTLIFFHFCNIISRWKREMTKIELEKRLREKGWICLSHQNDEEWIRGAIVFLIYFDGKGFILKQENGEWGYIRNIKAISFSSRRILIQWNLELEWYLEY